MEASWDDSQYTAPDAAASASPSSSGQIGVDDLDLATWIVLRPMESLVHAAVLDAPPRFGAAAVELAIVDALAGYLRLAP